ncbi:MAG: hypothetical protein AB7U83_12840 [Vicinamibacterales bacterium]
MLLLSVNIGAVQPVLPDGFRFPAPGEISGRSQLIADFDGDAIDDEVGILLAERGPGWVVVVRISSQRRDGYIRLEEGDDLPETLRLTVIPPGIHRTLCATQPRRCQPGEPRSLDLQRPAVGLTQTEGATAYFWWSPSAGTFSRTWISD